MGLIMEEKCNVKVVKCEPVEIIVLDENSQQSVTEQIEVAIKLEPESKPCRWITVKSEFQDLTPKPFVITIKEEEDDVEGSACLNNDKITTATNINIKFETLKSEEIEISDEESEGEEGNTIAQYTCNICGYKTALRDTLRSHVAHHIGEKPYKCTVCDYATSLKDIFQTHMLNHTQQKRYECDICDFASICEDKLIEHTLNHTGEKSLKCKIRVKPFKCPKCKYAADTRVALKKHMLIHSGKNILECYKCGYKTLSKSHLRQHVRVHFDNRVKSYKCNACKNRFLYKASLLKHMSKRPCKPGHT